MSESRRASQRLCGPSPVQNEEPQTSKTEVCATASYDFEDKYELSSISHELLYAKKFRDAIPICKLNIESFPRSWWAYDELGEAYMGASEKDLAIKSYKRSLQLDPANQNAALELKQLHFQ